jgi:hypothetical protein
MTNHTYEPLPENLNFPATKGDLQLLSDSLHEKLENIPDKEDFSRLLTSVDKLAREVQTYIAERKAESHRLE